MTASNSQSHAPYENGISITSSLNEFCEYTTAHGLGRFAAQSLVFGRTIWVTFLLATYGGFAYHLFTLIDRYTSTPLLTSLTTALPYEFPDVYICPTNPISMSKAYQPFSLETDIPRLRGLKKDCNITCQGQLSYFSQHQTSLSTPMRVYSDTLSAAETALMATISSNRASGNTSQCRFSLEGTEYTGNKSTVPVYGVTLQLLVPPNNLTLPSYVTELPCLAWNDAADKLKKAGAQKMAQRILAQNFSDGDNRCRSPMDLPLEAFENISSFLINTNEQPICYEDGSAQFSYNCFGTPIAGLTIQICTECCYKKNYKYIGLQYYDCYCSNNVSEKNEVYEHYCDYSCPGNAETFCGGSGNIKSVLQIRDSDALPIFLPFGGFLTDYLLGPYCFYTDPVNGLAMSYCNIPFCSSSSQYDCVTESEVYGGRQSAKYTGTLNFTSSGRDCMAWADVKEAVLNHELSLSRSDMVMWSFTFDEYNIDSLMIQTVDYEISNRTNYCRAAHVIYDSTYYQNDGARRDSVASARAVIVASLHPGCFYLNEAEKEVVFELCYIDACVDASASVSGTVRNSIGTAQLARQFSPSLDIGLVDCYFYTSKCTISDFQEILHPESGVCYKFIKEPFIKGLSLSELTEATLDVQLFTDAEDSFGIRPWQADYASKSLLQGIDAYKGNGNNAFKIMIVPDGTFPWLSQSFGVVKAQNSEFKVRLDKSVRFPKPPSMDCSRFTSPVTYMIDYWKPAGLGLNLTDQMQTSFLMVDEVANWTAKLDMLKSLIAGYNAVKSPINRKLTFKVSTLEDCLNEFMLRRFAENCRCLPTFLPIPEQLFVAYPICFNSTDAEYLYATDRCYLKQIKQVKTYRIQAREHCKVPCATRTYTIGHTSFPWPNLRSESAETFLYNLAKAFGYPNKVRSLRGSGVIYSAYLMQRNLFLDPEASAITYDYQLLTLQDQLARVSISAAQMFGEEVAEEEAYPIKNLLADIGGILGLWCGVSILTVCELMELVVSVILKLIHFVRIRQQNLSTKRGGNGSVYATSENPSAAVVENSLAIANNGVPKSHEEVVYGIPDGHSVSPKGNTDSTIQVSSF